MTITVIDEKPDVRKAEDYFKQAIETSLVNTFPKDSQVQMDFRETGSLPQITTISGYDAQNIYTVMHEETDMPEYSLGFGAVVERTGQELARPARLLPEGGQLTLGQIQSVIGDWTGNEEIKKSGLLNIQTANRNWQDFIQKFYNEEAVPLTQEQEESLGYKLVNAIGQSVQYVGLGSVNPMLAYLYMAMVVGEESAFNGLQAYIRENPEDTELKGFAEQSGKELLTNAIHVGTELYLEKAVGGFEGVMNAGVATAKGSFLKGTAKAFGKGFLSEFPTETLQNLADVGIEWYVGRLNDKEALKGALQAPIEGIIAGIAGGATGTSLFIMNRPSGIAKIDESLRDVIPDDQERQATSRRLYDNMVETLTDKISVELEESSQLKTKHGEIYESMKREVANLVKESGAFADKSESEVASYIESESKRFADNVLAEANKRKVWIDDVIKASDIVEKDGRLYLQGEYFGNETGKLGKKQFQQSMDIARENERLDSIYPKYTGETLDINGVEKTVYNSSGERIAQSKEALQNFYNWFGDSKVVDEQGRPLVVYHGTKSQRRGLELPEFDTFSREKSRSLQNRVGFFFGQTEEFVSNFGDRIMPVYLNLKNPKIFRNGTPTQQELYLEQKEVDTAKSDDSRYFAQQILNNSRKYTDSYERFVADIYHKSDIIPYQRRVQGNFYDAVKLGTEESYDIADKYRETLQKEGYDGVIIQDTEVDSRSNKGERNTQFVAFESNQIKSIDNRGTYSPTEGNIYKQSAYHGGPELEGGKFDLRFAQKAHGQTHGHGVYSTPVRTIANKYRIDFDEDFSVDGKKLSQIYSELSSNKEYEKAEIVADLLGNQDLFGLREGRDQYDKNAWKWFEKEIANKLESKGKLYELDVPEDMNLIDEQKTFDEQSEVVRFELLSAIQRINGYGLLEKAIESNATGAELYDALGRDVFFDKNGFEGGHTETQKSASEYLSKHNIKGIKYFDNGAGFVIFNPDDVKIIQKFYQTDVKNLPREKKITRGEFDALTKSIKLYEDANFSTLPHELAHFWLDNIWNYTQSGLASPEYMAQFNDVKKWLGIKDNQRFILPKQHEEFARAYEKYLVNGQYPSEAVKGAFNDYDNWIKSVYNTMRDVDINAGQKKYRPLSRKMFDFFDSMTTGELVAPANLEERTPEENVKYVEKEVEKAREVIKKDQEQLEENRKHTLMPVQTNTKTGYLTAYEKMTGEKVEAGSIDTKIEFNRAKDLVDNNPTLVKDIVEGRAEAPQGYVKNLIYQAYAEQQKKLGNTKERDIAMLNQALELRHYGQEISTQRNQYRNIFEKWASPTFWMLETLKAKQQLLADKSSVKLTDLEKQNKISKATKVGDIIEQQVRKGIKENKSVKQIVNDTVEALGLPTTFKQETVEELYPASYESNITAYNEIYKAVNKALGNSLTEQEVDEITRRADEMLTNLENSMDDDGNPSKDYFIKLKDMENYANSLSPTPLYRVFTDVLGPGNLMASVKTFLKNIVGNLPTFGLKFAVRRAIIGQKVSIVDKNLINDYKKRSFDIFNATGYNISSMEINSQKDISYGAKILGEDITHTQGKTYGTGLEQAHISEKVKYLLTGEYKNLEKATPKERFDYAIRGWGRLYEDWVYKWGLGSLHFNKMTMKDGPKEPAIKLGDIFFKDFAFTDHVALEASKEANGDVAKANAIFKDATRIIPETELGQEIRQRAVADALISTYQNRGKSAEGALKARKIIDIIPGAGKFAITFAMTPANLIAMGLETSFSPVIIAYDAVSETLRDKKISRTLRNKEAFKKIWAFDKETTSKMKGLITQSGVAGVISLLLAYGLFDDDDYMPDYALATPKERDLARELNIPYNSIRIGDTWVSLDYLGPLGSMFSGIMAAKRAETIGEWFTEYSREAGIQAFSLPAFEGFDKILEIGKRFIKGTPEETIDYTIETFTNAMYSRSMPTIISDITKAFDPYERETEKSGFKKMMLRTPGLRTKLDERVNVTTGMPEKRAQNDIKRVLLDVLTGAGMKEQVVNPIADELLRLAQKDEGVSLTGITYRGDLSKVLPEYKQKVREDFAKLYSKRVGALIKTDGYKRKTDEEKKESINAIRRAIVKELKGKYKGYIKK